jgi:hypothetical protein
MEPSDLQAYLRRCGVVVHHVAPMPSNSEGRRSVVVFLEETLGQFALARRCALRLPDVVEVSFSGHTRAVMYVVSLPKTADDGAVLAPTGSSLVPPSRYQPPTDFPCREAPQQSGHRASPGLTRSMQWDTT